MSESPTKTLYDQFGRPIEARGDTGSRHSFFEALLSGHTASSGERVNAKSAMKVVAYFACLRGISNDIAKMPHRVYAERDNGGRDALPGHAMARLLRDPNPQMTGFSVIQTWLTHALGFQGGFCEIVRSPATGRAVELWPLDPDRIRLYVDEDNSLWFVHTQKDGRAVPLPSRDVLHLHGLGLDGLTAWALTTAGRETIGNALAQQKYKGAFFDNSAMPSGVLESPAALSEGARDNLRREFEQRHSGADKAFRIAVLEEDLKWKPVSWNPKDAQLIESEYETGVDICRLFRFPQTKAGFLKEGHYNNLEHESRAYVHDCLMDWTVPIRQEYDRKLLTARERGQNLAFDIDTRALTMGDSQAQSELYSRLAMVGGIKPNEIRGEIGLNAVEGGDELFLQSSMVPLRTLLAQAEQTEQDVVAEPASEPEPVEPNNRAIWVPMFAQAQERLVKVYRDRLARAQKKNNFEEWLADWNEQSRKLADEQYSPIVHAYVCSTVNKATSDEIMEVIECTRAVVNTHMAAVRNDIEVSPADLVAEVEYKLAELREAEPIEVTDDAE